MRSAEKRTSELGQSLTGFFASSPTWTDVATPVAAADDDDEGDGAIIVDSTLDNVQIRRV